MIPAVNTGFILIGLIIFIATIVALVDAARRPSQAFDAAGTSKTLWVVLLAVGLLIGLLGLIAMIIYFASIRPKVIAAGG